MPNPKKKNKKQNNIAKLYKIEGGDVVLKNKSCPKCGSGVFLAEHANRESCGKCGYTVFKNKK